MAAETNSMPTWSVRIHFTEPTYARATGAEERVYLWTWTGTAPTALGAEAAATSAFRALFTLSGVGWVREISSIDTQQVQGPDSTHDREERPMKSQAQKKQTARATETSEPKLVQPSGRWTVVQFPEGAEPDTISQLVIEALLTERTQRAQGEKWVALLGEFFMGEGRPVLLLSPDVPADVIGSMDEFWEMIGPVKVRKEARSSLAFRGRPLVWLQDDFERSYPA
jgi:hypothetical protein